MFWPHTVSVKSALKKILYSMCVLLFTASIFAQDKSSRVMIGASTGEIHILGQATRPLLDVINQLSIHYGWAIDYEDPPYSKAESRDVTDPSWRNSHPAETGAFDPAGKPFAAFIDKPSSGLNATALALKQVVSEYNSDHNVGVFYIMVSDGNRLSVVGKSSNSSQTQAAFLDAVVENEHQKTSSYEALTKILARCAKAQKQSVEFGSIPANLLTQATIDGEPGESSCRLQMGRIMDSVRVPIQMRLLYDVSSETYYMNFIGVEEKSISGH